MKIIDAVSARKGRIPHSLLRGPEVAFAETEARVRQSAARRLRSRGVQLIARHRREEFLQ